MNVKLTRRNVLTGSAAIAGSSLITLAEPVKQLRPQPVPVSPGLPPGVHDFFKNSYLEAKAGGMTKEHINQLIGVTQTLFGQWDQDGTLDKLQSKLTPQYVAAFTFDKQALADYMTANGYQVDPNDLIGIESQFNDLKPQLPTDVRGGLLGVMTDLEAFSEVARTAGVSKVPGYEMFMYIPTAYREAQVRRVHEICMPAVYGAFVGLLALAAGEFPPAAIALGILAFIYELEALLIC